jgi:hypothetical protein
MSRDVTHEDRSHLPAPASQLANRAVVAVTDDLCAVAPRPAGMAWAYWQHNFPDHTLSEANVLLTKLREAGVMVHPWP